MNVTNSQSEKRDGKNGVICLVFMFRSWVMALKLSEIVYFLQFCADLSKKYKSVTTIPIYASETSHYTLSENGLWSKGVWASVYEILAIKISKKMVIQQKFDKIIRLQTLISPKL